MTKQIINPGTPGNLASGEPFYDALMKVIGNFDELYVKTASTYFEAAPFTFAGPLEVMQGTVGWRAWDACQVLGIATVLGAAPTGSAATFDVNLGGVTMYTTQANRPKILAGQTVSLATLPNIVQIPAGGLVTVDIDVVGSTSPGTDLSLQLLLSMAVA